MEKICAVVKLDHETPAFRGENKHIFETTTQLKLCSLYTIPIKTGEYNPQIYTAKKPKVFWQISNL